MRLKPTAKNTTVARRTRERRALESLEQLERMLAETPSKLRLYRKSKMALMLVRQIAERDKAI